MSAPDDYYDDDEAAEEAEGSEAGGAEDGGAAAPRKVDIRDWMAGKRGWLLIAALAIAQGLFAVIMLVLRSEARPMADSRPQSVQALAVEMLGHEVKLKDLYQSIPARGGKRISIGMELVLVLGQLPEERVEGAERPTPEEMDRFIAAIQAMEPRIRSRLNTLLQSIPPERYGRVEVFKTIKDAIRDMVNDGLEGLDFSKTVRPGIGRRRVTEVLLPQFLRQVS